MPFGHFLVVFGVDGEGKCSFAANAVTKRNIKITSQLFSLRGTQLTAPPQIPTISLPLEICMTRKLLPGVMFFLLHFPGKQSKEEDELSTLWIWRKLPHMHMPRFPNIFRRNSEKYEIKSPFILLLRRTTLAWPRPTHFAILLKSQKVNLPHSDGMTRRPCANSQKSIKFLILFSRDRCPSRKEKPSQDWGRKIGGRGLNIGCIGLEEAGFLRRLGLRLKRLKTAFEGGPQLRVL